MKTNILIAGYNNGIIMRKNPHCGFDGRRLDSLYIAANITSYKECEEIIKTLQIHKHCFDSPKNYKEIKP